MVAFFDDPSAELDISCVETANSEPEFVIPMGSSAVMAPVRKLRSAIGTNLDPNTCWMLARSLETVSLRMQAAFDGAAKVAAFLKDHPKVEKVRYLGFLEPGSRDHTIHHRQSGEFYGSTFAFDVQDGQDGAFRMLAIPAQIAGVSRIAVLTPPVNGQGPDRTILGAAHLLGLDEVYALGGAHGVAALGLGVAGLPRADRIFGPGNAYVAAAKALLAQTPGGAATDLPAGPSEVIIIADDGADPDFVALDLLAQAEHEYPASQ